MTDPYTGASWDRLVQYMRQQGHDPSENNFGHAWADSYGLGGLAPAKDSYAIADPTKPGLNNLYTSDGKGGVANAPYKQDNDNWMYMIPAVLGTIMTAGTLGPELLGGEAAAGAGAGAGAGATGAFDLGGIAGGVEGAGGATGLGSAFGLGDASLGGTLAGTAGYDAALDLPGGLDIGSGGLGDVGVSDLSGTQWADAINPANYSHEGDHYPTPESTANSPINVTTGPNAAPTIDLSSPAATNPQSSNPFSNKSPLDLIKPIASALLKNPASNTGNPFVYGGGQTGFGGVFNQAANETPGMLAAHAAPQGQQQAIAQALLLGMPEQPKFNPLQFNSTQLAQALQDS